MRSNVSANRPLHSAELARLAGVSTDTLRYYERLRLLPAAPRSASGYRQFPQQALARVRLIRGALAIGFSVRELAGIFADGRVLSASGETRQWWQTVPSRSRIGRRKAGLRGGCYPRPAILAA